MQNWNQKFFMLPLKNTAALANTCNTAFMKNRLTVHKEYNYMPFLNNLLCKKIINLKMNIWVFFYLCCTAVWVQTANRFLLTLSKVTGISPCKCTDVHWLCLHSNYDTEVKVVITCYNFIFVQCNNNYISRDRSTAKLLVSLKCASSCVKKSNCHTPKT